MAEVQEQPKKKKHVPKGTKRQTVVAKKKKGVQGREVPRVNYVAMDELWKTFVNNEKQAYKAWPEKWGHFAIPWRMLRENLEEKDSQPPSNFLESATGGKRLPAPPISEPLPSPPFPLTSSALIGWRSSRPEYSLEKFGRASRPLRRLAEELWMQYDGLVNMPWFKDVEQEQDKEERKKENQDRISQVLLNKTEIRPWRLLEPRADSPRSTVSTNNSPRFV